MEFFSRGISLLIKAAQFIAFRVKSAADVYLMVTAGY